MSVTGVMRRGASGRTTPQCHGVTDVMDVTGIGNGERSVGA